MYKASFVLRITFNKGCCCILLEKGSGRHEKRWREKCKQGHYSRHIYGMPTMHSYNDKQDLDCLSRVSSAAV